MGDPAGWTRDAGWFKRRVAADRSHTLLKPAYVEEAPGRFNIWFANEIAICQSYRPEQFGQSNIHGGEF